jgi:predicted NBD/HSP70 family sugar kinase
LSQAPGRPTHLRAMNERRVLEVVLQEGAISRAQLSRQTGLSKPTISQALARLEEAGLLRAVGRTSGGRGATALLYDLDPRSGHVIAIDVGRRWARGVLADIGGRSLVGRSEPTRSRSSEGLVQQLARIARELVNDAGVDLAQIRAITLGTPGVVRAEGDRVKLAPSLPGLQRHGALERLGAEFGGAPLRVENDVNLAALAELASGHGIDNDDFVFVSVGTGVGMALVLGGELRRGVTGAAGEIGYLPLPDPAPPSRGRGSFELTVAADAFLRQAQQRGLAGRTAEEVVDLAREGNRSAQAVVHEEAVLIGRGVAAVTAVVDPGLVVLGGGLGRGAGDLLAPVIADTLRSLSPATPAVVTSALGEDVVLRGALAASLLDAHDRVFGDFTGYDGTSSATERAQHTGTRITGLHLAALLEAP